MPITEQGEEKEMSNDRTNIDDLLTLRGVGGMGVLGGYGCRDTFATPSANAERIISNGQRIEDQADCTREVLGLGLKNISDSFETTQRFGQFAQIQADSFRSELRTADKIAALQAEMNANARAADKCCCETQLRIVESENRLSAQMAALSKETISRDLDRAERELIALKTQVACGCTTGCSRPCGHGHNGNG